MASLKEMGVISGAMDLFIKGNLKMDWDLDMEFGN